MTGETEPCYRCPQCAACRKGDHVYATVLEVDGDVALLWCRHCGERWRKVDR